MRKYKKIEKKIIETKQILTKATCDFCKKEFKINKDLNSAEELTSFYIKFGYGSKYDMETWYFDICDKCAEELKNKYKPNIQCQYC